MPKAIRQVYGETLAAMGGTRPALVVLDADVSSSTQTKFFAGEYPDRFFNMGIAEANMVATAAGLASQGMIPFANTFATFITSIGYLPARALICYANLSVKLAGAYCGLSDALDGASHHSTEDIAIMRTLPNMRILCPSDPVSTAALTGLAADTEGPFYLRLSRDVYPDLYPEGTKFRVGGANVVRGGEDITVFACGIMVHKALEAAEMLATDNISVRVVDLYSVKPLDEDLILKCVRETGAVVTAEEHNIIGGMGGAVAECVARAGIGVPFETVGIRDKFTESGQYAQLLSKYGLDKNAVAEAIRLAVSKK